MTKLENSESIVRCGWCSSDPLYQRYHDEEWGVPQHDERLLFEMLCLEGQQAGLSWITVLRKRAHYQKIFKNFLPKKVAAMTDAELETILQDTGVVRNRLKIYGIRKNALAYLTHFPVAGSFDAFIWSFVGGKTVANTPRSMADIPVSTAQSDALAKDLKKKGFTFVGSTICYAFMQACGLVDDHTQDCWRAAKTPARKSP